jgi:hypothetical protein
VWNQAHLRRILHAYESHHNQHRPHRSLNSAAPLKPLPVPVDLDRYHVRRQAHTACLINEYRLVALRGRGFRHAQAPEVWFEPDFVPETAGRAASRPLTSEQFLALLDAARESRLNAYVVLSLAVGVRTEEAMELWPCPGGLPWAPLPTCGARSGVP